MNRLRQIPSARALGLALALASTLALTACQTVATQPVPQERSVLLQRMDDVLRGAQAGLRITSQPDPIPTGHALSVEVSTAQPGYLYLYQVGTDGKTLDVVFPNAVDGANYLQAGVTALPRPSWKLRAHGPAGVGYLVAVLTAQPLNLLTLQAEANQGRFITQGATPGPYAAALGPLREVATP